MSLKTYIDPACSPNVAAQLDAFTLGRPAAGSVTLTATFSDVEWVELCDVNGVTSTPFLRRITTTGGISVNTDFLLDGVANYTTTGVVGLCSVDSALAAVSTLTKEYAGAATITQANVLADLGVANLLELDILVRQVNAPDTDLVPVTFGGSTMNLPLGGSTTFRALPGMKLDSFSITLDAGEAVDITAQGVN